MGPIIEGVIRFKDQEDVYNDVVNRYRLNTEYTNHYIKVCDICGASDWSSSNKQTEEKMITFTRKDECDPPCQRCQEAHMRNPELVEWVLACIQRHGVKENRFTREQVNKKFGKVFERQRKLCGNSNFFIHGFDKHRVQTIAEAVLSEFGILIVEDEQ